MDSSSNMSLHAHAAVRESIRHFRATGRFTEADHFIASLPAEVKGSRKVTIEIAQLYLIQGQWRLAAQTCEDATRSVAEAEQYCVPDAEAAAFELLSAFIGIGRYSRLKTALKTAARVAEIWGFQDPLSSCISGSPEKTQGGCELPPVATSLSHGTFNLSLPKTPVTISESTDSIEQYEALVIHYYWRILVVAADQGLLSVEVTRSAAVEHLRPFRQRLQASGLLYEARMLIYFEASILEDRGEALAELQAFVQLLNPHHWPVERAYTLTDIVEILYLDSTPKGAEKTEEAQAFTAEARALFDRASHTFGNIDLDLLLLNSKSNETLISAWERFRQKLRLARRYYEIGHLQNGSRCLMFAISPEMVADNRFRELNDAVRLLDEKIRLAGGELLKQVSLLHAVAQAALKAPEYGFALQCLEDYLQHLPAEIAPRNHYGLVSLLAQVYQTFGRHAEALRLAQEALRIAESGMAYSDQSDAAMLVGHMRYQMAQKHADGSPEQIRWIMSTADILGRWADQDANNGCRQNERLKCQEMANWENHRLLHSAAPDEEGERNLHAWIERAKATLTDENEIEQRFEIVQLQLRVLMRKQAFHESSKLIQDLLSEAKAAPHVRLVTMAGLYFSASIQTNLWAWRTIRESVNPEGVKNAVDLLGTSLRLLLVALDHYHRTDGVELITTCTVEVWRQLRTYVDIFPDGDNHTLLTAFLAELEKAEQIVDRMRSSVIPVKGIVSLMSKRELVAQEACLKLYSIGVAVSLRLGDAGSSWTWIQKGKSRAFADALGATVLLPQSLRDRIAQDSAARELLDEEQMLLEMLAENDANHVLVSRRLAVLRGHMTENPLLREVNRIKRGIIDIDIGDELKNALLHTGLDAGNVKFIDWFVPPGDTDGGNGRIILFVRQVDGTTWMKESPLSAADVMDWLDEAFRYPEMSEPPLSRGGGNRLLKKMNGLVEGLGESTSPNDLLVLSPPALMKNMPLHALFVGRVSLIERNLVVYSSTVSTFRQILFRTRSSEPLILSNAETARPGDEDDDEQHHGMSYEEDRAAVSSFFAVYEEPEHADERQAIFDNVRQLSSLFPGRAFLGPEATKTRFLERASESRWIHYHGHARVTKDIVKSSLCLSDGNDLFATTTSGDNHDDDQGDNEQQQQQPQEEEAEERGPQQGIDELDVTQLFAASLPAGMHLTVIACDSGRQDSAPGDEPLGIVPALLHAGAASVLGCMWPIDSSTGRKFSEAFYQELWMVRGSSHSSSNNDDDDDANPTKTTTIGGERKILHLAQALRGTIRRMMTGELGPELRQPYHWAAFILHGAWFLKL